MVRDGPHHTVEKFRYEFRCYNYDIFVLFQMKRKRSSGDLGQDNS